MAFAKRLFEQHGTVVHRYFRRLTGDPAAAQDLTQEVFLRVVRGGDRYEHRDRERAWVAATTMRDRCSLEFGAGGSTLTMKCEISTDGKTWTPTFEGTAKKTNR